MLKPPRLLSACRGLLPFCIIAALAITAGWWILRGTERRAASALTAERESLDRAARADVLALRETVSRTLEHIDTLHSLARLVILARRSGNTGMERDIMAELEPSPEKMGQNIGHVSGIGITGYIEWTNLGPRQKPIYVGDRETFRTIASGAAASFVTAPTTSQASGKREMLFSKGVYGPDGALWGITVVTVEPSTFSGLAAAVGISGNDAMAFQRLDGMILARNLGGEGQAAAGGGNAWRYRLAREGSFEAPSPIDGVLRSLAWQRLDDFGLVVLVALDLQERLDRLQPSLEKARDRAVTSAGLVALVGFFAMAGWYWRRRMQSTAAAMTAIRRNETMFRLIAENLPDAIRLIDRTGTILYANPPALRFLGADLDALGNPGAQTLIHPDDVAKSVWTQLENDPGLRGGRSEIRLLPPDGRTIWLQSVVQVIGDDTTPAGTPWAVSSSRDITWQREAEGSLRRTKEELDDVLEAASGILFRSEKGADGAWRMFVSDSATAITGFTPAEAAAPNFLRSRRDPAFDAAMMAHDVDVETHGTGTVRYRFRHKDGHWLWLEAFTRTAIEDDRVFYVGFTRDITQQFERDRRAVQIAKMAILGEMTTGMAHELNQPLAAISMMAENSIALLDPDKPMHRILHPKLDRIVAQVGRAAAIIADMRHLGHGEPAARGTIGVAAAIQEANATLDGRLQRAGIGLRIDIEPGLPMAEGDARSLEQALINLIGNAADAIEMQEPPLPADRRVIRVTVALSGADIAIAVADRAGGIDSAVLPHLFEPFFTTKQAGSGTGLGLSISRGMVKHMNGTLSARNEGDGAVFEIRLPCAVASEIPA